LKKITVLLTKQKQSIFVLPTRQERP